MWGGGQLSRFRFNFLRLARWLFYSLFLLNFVRVWFYLFRPFLVFLLSLPMMHKGTCCFCNHATLCNCFCDVSLSTNYQYWVRPIYLFWGRGCERWFVGYLVWILYLHFDLTFPFLDSLIFDVHFLDFYSFSNFVHVTSTFCELSFVYIVLGWLLPSSDVLCLFILCLVEDFSPQYHYSQG